MDSARNDVYRFLDAHGMGADIGIDHMLDVFMEDMRAGLEGNVRSLLMIPTYMEVREEIPRGRPIIVMDAGGTNFRVAQVAFDAEGRADISHFAKYPMPGTQKRIDREEFLNTVIDYMESIRDASDQVGFCFSFPTEILPDGDGRLYGFNKEVEVSGSEGMIIGRSLNEALEKRGCAPKRFMLLNDTVAAMFSGICGFPGRRYESYIGLILGTGTNTCYMEDIANIGRIGGGSGYMAINMESGGFAGVSQGDYDKELDAGSNNPGDHIYEKMVSGAYRADLIYRTLRGAASEGMISPGFVDFLESVETLYMRDISVFLEQPFGDNPLANATLDNDRDRSVLYHVIDRNFERVAQLMTVNIGGILRKTGRGKEPTRPVCVIAEGTVFHSSPFFRRKLDYYVRRELNERRGLYCDFVAVEDATLIGTATAGLMNAK